MRHGQQTHEAATPLRPVVYARSATDDGDQLSQRVEDALEIARMQSLDVAQEDIIAEHGSGGRIEGRPGIQRILEQAARGEISHLVTHRVSNLSRDHHGARQIIATLAEAGVAVVTLNEGDKVSEDCDVATALLTM